MKRLRVQFLTLLCFALAFTATAQTRHALIFAIGNYTNWPKISSLQDVSFIDSALKTKGFTDIQIVTDTDATVQGISDALNNLISRVNPGDVVAIHVSSHGEQVQDDNKDETDGLDESIVTYNAKLPSRGRSLSEQEYENFQKDYYRDDMFGDYISQLRAKLGSNGDVVVFMDLCHSGTGTRGVASVRGGQPALVSGSFDPGKYAADDTSGVFKENKSARGDDSNLATYVVYSAAEANELDYETIDEQGRGMGSLTYAICKVFGSLDNGNPTYRSVFADIQTVMNEKTPQQHPIVEGTGLDRTIFGGNFIKQLPYTEIEKINGAKLSLKAGKMRGFDSGARVVLYPKGTADIITAAKLATGVVVKTSSYSSEVLLDKDPGIKQAAAGWVFITEPVYKMEPIAISFNKTTASARGSSNTQSFSQEDINTIKKCLSNYPLITFNTSPELLIVRGVNSDSIKVASTGYLFKTINNAVTDSDSLKTLIGQYIQYKFLKNLHIKDERADADVKLVPVINGAPDTTHLSRSVMTAPEFNNGNKCMLWVKNNGEADIYINILDMQPDGIINKVFPYKQKNIYPGDLKIAAGTSRLFTDFPITIGPPYGTEIFKIFASNQKIDLEDIATTRGATRGVTGRGNLSVLEGLVKISYDAGTRGAEPNNIANADGSCFNVPFVIKP